MKKALLSLILFSVTLLGIFTMATPVVEAQTKGDVKVVVDGDTVYLSTEASDGAQVTRTTTTDTIENGRDDAEIGRPFFDGFVIPAGFAKSAGEYLNRILSLVMVFAALLVFFYLIWGAFDWITSGGDKGKTEQARGKIVSAIIGIIIIAASYAILLLILNFLGFENLNDVLRNAGLLGTRV